jgi:hypothetical protein
MTTGLQEAVGDGFAWPVIGTNVAVRDRPSIKARVVGRLDHELVPVSDMDAPDQSGAAFVWQMVKLPGGAVGYVETSLLWGPDRDWHVCFAQFDGEWRVSLFDRAFRAGR